MSEAPVSTAPPTPPPKPRSVRWWPLLLIAAAAIWKYKRIHSQPDNAFQVQTIATAMLVAATFVALLGWWLFLSRVPWRTRFIGVGLVLALFGLGAALFHVTGVSGDLVPILEPRWAKRATPLGTTANTAPTSALATTAAGAAQVAADFPQFLGPDRNAILPGPTLATNWADRPPRIVWRQPIGAGWAGFALVGNRALTQEQQGPQELVTCSELATGKRLWSHADETRYFETIAGEGPRTTPTVVGNRVFTLGATGRLNCLDLATGNRVWTHSLTNDAACRVPAWGFSGSPLVHDGLVVVSAGGGNGKSLLAYRAETGDPVWSGGSSEAGYASPFFTRLADTPQIILFNHQSVAAHDPATGAVLWEQPFGLNMPLVANPIVVSTNRVLFSAGYGVGAELFEVRPGTNAPASVWKSKRLKAKFSNPVFRDGFVYGLDDGMLACLDVQDGAQRWKEGRYGHGQGLLVGDLYLLMSEPGELVLLHPTPVAANEVGRFPVFDTKTWNPLALGGDRLLVRNDREAALLILPLASQGLP